MFCSNLFKFNSSTRTYRSNLYKRKNTTFERRHEKRWSDNSSWNVYRQILLENPSKKTAWQWFRSKTIQQSGILLGKTQIHYPGVYEQAYSDDYDFVKPSVCNPRHRNSEPVISTCRNTLGKTWLRHDLASVRILPRYFTDIDPSLCHDRIRYFDISSFLYSSHRSQGCIIRTGWIGYGTYLYKIIVHSNGLIGYIIGRVAFAQPEEYKGRIKGNNLLNKQST